MSNPFIEIGKQVAEEWPSIRMALLTLADSVYGLEKNQRKEQLHQLINFLSDMNDLFIKLAQEPHFADAIRPRNPKWAQLMQDIEGYIGAEQFFELGELIRYELADYLDETILEVSNVCTKFETAN